MECHPRSSTLDRPGDLVSRWNVETKLMHRLLREAGNGSIIDRNDDVAGPKPRFFGLRGHASDESAGRMGTQFDAQLDSIKGDRNDRYLDG